MAKALEDTITLGEIINIPNALPLQETLDKVMSQEEIQVYNDLTNRYLLETTDIPESVKVTGLSLLKTLSHLSKSKDKLDQQVKALPLAQNREIY